MAHRWVVLTLLVACSDPKLAYKLKSDQRGIDGFATADDMKSPKASLEVSGPSEGPYLAAIRGELATHPNNGKITVRVAGNEPGGSSGTFGTRVIVDALWWRLPKVTTLHDELVIDFEYTKQSHAALGRAIGQLVGKLLVEKEPKGAAVPSPTTSPAVSITTGHDIACSLHADKSVHCWGLAVGDLVGTIPSRVPLPPASEIAAGDRAMCARLETGEVACIGKRGQEDRDPPTKPVKVCGIEKATKLAVGYDTGCAITETGDVRCWTPAVAAGGDCAGRMLLTDAKQVTGVAKATQLSVGYWGACALVEGGKAMCWKNRAYIAEPAKLPAGVDVQIGFDPCVVEPSGQITCDRAKDETETLVTARVAPGSKVTLEPMFGCAIAPDAQLSCWGVLPEGTTSEAHKAASRTPTPLLGNVVAVDVNIAGACMATKDGAVYCWGKGYFSPALPENYAPDPTKVTIY